MYMCYWFKRCIEEDTEEKDLVEEGLSLGKRIMDYLKKLIS